MVRTLFDSPRYIGVLLVLLLLMWLGGACAPVDLCAAKVCESGQLCREGACVLDCPKEQVACGLQCADVFSDKQHCGQCGQACLTYEACYKGTCKTVCKKDKAWCGKACISLDSSKEHCGRCDNACKGESTCQSGVCKCEENKALCGESCIDTHTDKKNCGKCGAECKSLEACEDSKCVCEKDASKCGDRCIKLGVDDKNCGKCGNVCSKGLRCKKGVCTSMWARQVEGDFPYLNRIAIGPTGNVYVFGSFQGKATFGSKTYEAGPRNQSIYVAKLSSKGTFQWVTRFPSNHSRINFSTGIKVDNNDNVFITGTIYGSVTFGKTILRPTKQSSAYIAKLDAFGKLLWVTQPNGSGQSHGNNLVLDKRGNSYITGTFSGNCTFGETKLGTQNHRQIFVAKLDPKGKFQWAIQAKGKNSYVKGMAIDSLGNIYIAGLVSENAELGTFKATKTEQFFAKLDPRGSFTKLTTWPTESGTGGNVIVKVDQKNNAYIYLPFTGTLRFGSSTLTQTFNFLNPHALVKFDNRNNFVWAKEVGCNHAGSLQQYFAIDGLGNIHVNGLASSRSILGDKKYSYYPENAPQNIYVTRVIGTFDSFGKVLDYNLLPQTLPKIERKSNSIHDITADQKGNTYTVGSIDRVINFTVDPLTSKGKQDLFIAKNLP